jgi:hypothetical protein
MTIGPRPATVSRGLAAGEALSRIKNRAHRPRDAAGEPGCAAAAALGQGLTASQFS